MDDTISRQAAIDKFKPWLEVKGYNWGELNMLRAVINELENMQSIQPEQRWISVSERLPEDFKKVLVFWWEHSEPMIDTAFWQKDAKRFDGQHWVRIEDKITHWMPLPEPARLEND